MKLFPSLTFNNRMSDNSGKQNKGWQQEGNEITTFGTEIIFTPVIYDYSIFFTKNADIYSWKTL
jgi:hypothetical protein